MLTSLSLGNFGLEKNFEPSAAPPSSAPNPQSSAVKPARPDAEIPFDWILNDATGRDGAEVDYVLSEPAKCPKCFGEVTEKTLVEG